MVHLRPLPGSPLWRGSMEEIVDVALADARAIAAAGADGIVIENFGDRPFAKRVESVTLAAMTRAIAEIGREVKIPFGVNVLRNDPEAALAVAVVTGAAFIRINVHAGAMLTDQGIIEGDAAATLRRRAALGSEVAIFADWMVKHAAPLADANPDQSALDLRERGLADAIIVSGRSTGDAADPSRMEALRKLLPDAPLLVGSGLSRENAAEFADADGAIVGTSVKRGGAVDAPIDRRRLAALIGRFKG